MAKKVVAVVKLQIGAGKAMAGLLDYVRTARFGPADKVLFIHTGGNLALFA